MRSHEHVIHPVQKYRIRCPRNGCEYACSHATLPEATDCVTAHDATHHQVSE